MQPQSQPLLPAPAALSLGEITTAGLLTWLKQHPAKALIFEYDGREILPGYHVTEVKTGTFEALDCGANFERWHETYIQLWDIPPHDGRSFLPAAKFSAIIGKVAEKVPFDPNAKLTFEVSNGRDAIQLYRAIAVEIDGDAIRVQLSRHPASCKPRDRWLEGQDGASRTCC
jgi:hypothetical protein